MSVYDLFEKHNDEHLKFERLEHPMSHRPDIAGLILLDMLFQEKRQRI